MRRDCLITARLAGPCASCRQPAWPAHVRGLLIYCEACCGCGRGGAQAAGTHAAPGGAQSGPARGMPEKRATGAYIAPAELAKARDTAPPVPSDSGAVSGPARAIVRAGLPGAAPAGPGVGMLPPTPGVALLPPWPRCRRDAWPPPPLAALAGVAGRSDAALAAARRPCCGGRPRPGPRYRPGPPAGVALAGPASQGQAQVPAALRGKTILRRNVSAQNFVEEWRFV